MPRKFGFVVALLTLATAPAATFARQAAHQHTGPAPQNVGAVTFENSCAPEVQASIGRGMALLHSFWYEAVDREFRQAAGTDPACAIAWWGVAMAQWQPLWEVRGPAREALERGRQAIEKGQALDSGTAREREYLAALAQFYANHDTIDHTTRVLAYESAMARLHAKYPRDAEATALYGLALLASAAAQPPDKTYARQKKAGALLQPVFRAQPEHPGVAHYIIHAYDYPSLAAGALEAARRYATIAPDSPHALHMPSHIFTRLGLWEEVIATNRLVVTAAIKHDILGEALHGSDYQVFGHLQRGEDDLARQVIEAKPPLADVPKSHVMFFAGLYATAAMPARFALERRAWAEAAGLPEPDGFPGGRYAWADAAIYFARALGAARTGRIEQARRDIEKLDSLHQTLVKHQESYWAAHVDIQRRAAESWLALADDRPEAALALAREAADLEDGTDKHPVTPGQIVPARDLLGQMLLALKRPREAIIEFEKVMRAEPNRFSPLYGAARSAELAGDKARARELYAALVKIAPDSQRSEVQHAREVAGAPSAATVRR
jgi:tetratricopeptide (TPR) repeat protein